MQRAAGHLRAGLREAVAGLPAAERGLVPGLVVGDTAAMPVELEQDFRTAGLTHLTAVSGANLVIVVGFALYVGRWLGFRVRWLPALGALALVGFVVLARPQPSVLRAAAMGLVGLAALATGRRRGSLAALAAAMLALLLLDPWLARSYGFALSVLATAGLLLIAPGWTRWMCARRVPAPLAQALAVPAAAQVACAPVVALLSGQVSLVAVPANLLVAPAVAPATVLGVLATLAGAVSDPAARAFGWLAGLPAWWIVTVAQRAAAVPDAAVAWPSSAGARSGWPVCCWRACCSLAAPPAAHGVLAGCVAVVLVGGAGAGRRARLATDGLADGRLRRRSGRRAGAGRGPRRRRGRGRRPRPAPGRPVPARARRRAGCARRTHPSARRPRRGTAGRAAGQVRRAGSRSGRTTSRPPSWRG